MKVLEINSLSKEEGFIYYINRYKGTAVLEILSEHVSVPLSFTIETSPFGQKTIQIGTLPNTLNYPVSPIVSSLRNFIKEMDKSGVLPQT